ncbi:MAG: hypothetical protein HUJ22_03080 [Gracilimonas sp.]|uniref:hypothetical protein n=1 Tax=Gracilimonas sp. TaxID=1974203 RepID=UPI0019979F28|nr:hypothetical protein [Gracilimonas sp.]MBD3615530.1 hypothetical protein [Gracilimonas sp.]
MRNFLTKEWLFLFGITILFYNCDGNEKFEVNPFTDHHNSSPVIKKCELQKNVIPSDKLREAELIDSLFLSGNLFEIAEVDSNEIYLFSKADQKLYRVLRTENNFVVDLISDSGAGPDQIENGIRFFSIGNRHFIIQRNRVTELKSFNEAVELNVLHTFRDYINYFKIMEDGLYLVNKFTPDDNASLRLVGENFVDKGIYYGGKIITNNGNKYDSILDFSLVGTNGSNEIQIFNYLPFIGVFNQDRVLKKVFRVSPFYQIHLSSDDGSLLKIDFEETEIFTQIVNLYQFNQGTWIIFEDLHLDKDVNEFRVKQKNYRYFLLKKDLELECIGVSKYYILPLKNGFIFNKDGSVFKTD